MLHYLLGCCIQTGISNEIWKQKLLKREVFPKLKETSGAYHWVAGIVKVKLSTHQNVQMALVRAKRQVLDASPQERLELDTNAKEYLQSKLTVDQAQELKFPVEFIKELWPNETGLLFTNIMLHTILLHTDFFFFHVLW